jgi:hypothetical protein
MSEHQHKTINHRGDEVWLDKPLNESAMTAEERRAWHEAKAEKQRKEKI